jgi:hypothetical protein
MRAVLKRVHSIPTSMVMYMSNSTSESQDEDSMLMCMSNSHSDAVIMSLPLLKGVLASRVKGRACRPCKTAILALPNEDFGRRNKR